jgi:hypothetical protein
MKKKTAKVSKKTKRVVRKAPGKTPAKKRKATKAAVRKVTKKKVTKKKAKKKPNPVGRPTRYQQRFATELAVMFTNGESVAEVCVLLGICKQTFYTWCDTHPEFLDAYKKGQELSEAWWHKIGRANATGRMRGSAATWIFNMKNRFNWTDRTEVKSDVNVRESGIGVDDDMDEEEWVAAASRQQAIMKGIV